LTANHTRQRRRAKDWISQLTSLQRSGAAK
jgi:hypothetical protein